MDIDLRPYFEGSGRRDYGALVKLMDEYEAREGMESLLERAKRRLDSMAVVGTVERFNESVALICDYLGIPSPPDAPIENVGHGHTVNARYRGSSQVSADLTDLIDRLNRCDHELYNYGSQLLDKSLAERRPT